MLYLKKVKQFADGVIGGGRVNTPKSVLVYSLLLAAPVMYTMMDGVIGG